MNKKYILLGILTAGIVFLIFYYFINSQNKDVDQSNDSNSFIKKTISTDNRKKFENPINGEITLSETKPEYLSRKPLAVMINNATPARPQAGVTKADIVYEIVAEGGITRFLAVYLSELPEKVGPIRSVREYYLVIVKELGDAMLMHIGYSPQARQRIDEWDILSLGLSGADFYRDSRGNPEVATEHTAFASGKELYSFGEAIKYNNLEEIKSWRFNDSFSIDSFKKANYLKIDFWYEGEYSAIFKYDSVKSEYVRYSGIVNNQPQLLIDDLSKTEVRVKNVIVQFANEVPIPNDDKGRLDYELLGEGKALIFRNGIVIESKWKKDSLNNRTMFYDLNGKEIELNRGKIWVSVVPSRNENQVKYTE
jgi:hypothetical protein